MHVFVLEIEINHEDIIFYETIALYNSRKAAEKRAKQLQIVGFDTRISNMDVRNEVD
jgi:hypothetical protein